MWYIVLLSIIAAVNLARLVLVIVEMRKESDDTYETTSKSSGVVIALRENTREMKKFTDVLNVMRRESKK